jgi:hypothetical protein
MSLVVLFAEEIEMIQDDRIRAFVVDALDSTPEFYSNLSLYVKETKSATKKAQALLDILGSTDYTTDVIISAVLLQDITRFYIDDDGDVAEDIMHPLSVRQRVIHLVGAVGRDGFDDIMRTVESSHGLNSPIPQVMPMPEDPVYVWILPFVNRLVKEETA